MGSRSEGDTKQWSGKRRMCHRSLRSGGGASAEQRHTGQQLAWREPEQLPLPALRERLEWAARGEAGEPSRARAQKGRAGQARNASFSQEQGCMGWTSSELFKKYVFI